MSLQDEILAMNLEASIEKVDISYGSTAYLTYYSCNGREITAEQWKVLAELYDWFSEDPPIPKRRKKAK